MTAANDRPILGDDALHGLAGDVVFAFDPFTEADQAAVLASLLAAFGNCVGRSPHTWVGETRHGINIDAVIVGATARSRKGTSWAIVERVFRGVDSDWLTYRQESGFGSGEGVIWAVRDASEPKIDKKGEQVIDDPGVRDKRLMIVEQEFSTVLKVQGRDGSIMSEIFRKAWDSPGRLTNNVKRSPVSASDPHISVIGHITSEELARTLTTTDQANGMGNRCLWIFAARSKLLSRAPRLPDQVANDLSRRVADAIRFARATAEMGRTEAADELWDAIYPELSKDFPGVVGALTARAEAQVTRLAMIYALLDQSSKIEPEHLKAAAAFWQYADGSVRYIFGDRTGDSVADRIMDGLTLAPMTETEIRDLFHRNQSRDRIQAALQTLVDMGRVESIEGQTGGRPSRMWIAL